MSTLTNVAIAVHHTPVTEGTWDGPAAVSAMPNDAAVLRYCHAWRDAEGDPNAKGTYKFPHHRTDDGPAVLAGVRNALARLSNADIPDADRAGVERHLRAHLEDGHGGHHHEDDGDAMHNLAPLRGRLRTARPVARLVQGQRDWYRITNRAGLAEIAIYDEIGMLGVSAQDFVAELRGLKAERIDLHLNSPGGEVFEGFAIYNALREHPAQVHVQVDSLAASIASVIAMAGDRIEMAKTATMMIHDGMGLAVGNAADMRKTADLLDQMSDTIAGVYADRAGGTVADWRDRMRAETWYTAQEALDAGLCDAITGQGSGDMSAKWDLSIFNYAGRAQAPAPKKTKKAKPVPDWDPATFRAAIQEAVYG